MMKVQPCQLLLIKKDITRGQIPLCSLLIQFAGIQEHRALNPLVHATVLTAGQKRWIERPFEMSFFQKGKGSEKTSEM